jgi:eukaryotic-like serine/threonine-protein kinase
MQFEIFGDRYLLQYPIGRGSIATVYRGLDTHMDRSVAIKVLHGTSGTDEQSTRNFMRRFLREAKALSELQHPNVIQVYDYGPIDSNYYIVMELVEGTDLRRYLRSRGILDIDRAITITHDVALGLGAAHQQGIVHCNIKPQNILMGRDGSIKLTDFSIALLYRSVNAKSVTDSDMTAETAHYYSPEQALGEIVTPATDVYALGIVMYEMLTGRIPFDGANSIAVELLHVHERLMPPGQRNPAIFPDLEKIVLRCLEKVPEMRYRDGAELVRALEALSVN